MHNANIKGGPEQPILILVMHNTNITIPKVVIATNIAETSVTIPGVTHVVDCCR